MRHRVLIVFLCLCVFARTAAQAESISGYPILQNTAAASSDGATLSVMWFGAASVLIDDGTNALLFDPFVSRQENTPLGILFQAKAKVAHERVARRVKHPGFQRVNAIFVGHSHYDHSVDVARFASLLDVPVFGSPSTKRVVSAGGHLNVKAISNGEVLHENEIGTGFRVHVLQGKHGAASFFINPLATHVAPDFSVPAPISKYGLGEVHSFVIEHKHGTILHIGSAGVSPGSLDPFVGKIDLVLLALVGRPPTETFLAQVVGKLRPKTLIPIHYDNLFRAADRPMRAVGPAKLKEFFKVMSEDYPKVRTGILSFDQPFVVQSRP